MCYRLVEVVNKSSLKIGNGRNLGHVTSYALEITNDLSNNFIIIDKNFVFYKDFDNNYHLIDYIGNEAFVVLPNTSYNYKINAGAFYTRASINHIQFSSKVTNIGEAAFCECVGLQEVYIPKNIEQLGTDVFVRCQGLISVKIDKDSKLTTLPPSTFQACNNLKYVIIPKSIETVGGNVFTLCDKVTLFYYGTAEEWTKVSLGLQSGFSAEIYFYSETKPSVNGSYWHMVNGEPVVW